jgi:hypothetical protein
LGIHLHKFNRKQDIRQMQVEGEEKNIPVMKYLVSMLALIVFLIILKLNIIYRFIGSFRSAIFLLISSILMYLISFLAFNVLKMIKAKTKKLTILSLIIKQKLNKRQFYHYISMSVTVFLVIFLLIFTVFHLQKRIDNVSSEYTFDLIMTRMISDQEQIYEDVLDLEETLAAENIAYYEYVETNINQEYIEQVISIDPKTIDTYFNLDIDDEIIARFNHLDMPQIVLPLKYQEVYDLNVGDDISITLSQTYQHIELKIAGFYQKEAIELAFVNLYAFDTFEDIKYNAIMIDAINKDLLENQLIDSYGKNMVNVIDFDEETIQPLTQDMLKVKNYLTFIVGAMMISFIISLFNHATMLDLSLAHDHAKMVTLGLSKRQLIKYHILEQTLSFVILMTISSLTFLLIFSVLSEFITIFRTYEHLVLTPKTFLICIMLNAIIWIFLTIYQIYLLYKTKIIYYIRTF